MICTIRLFLDRLYEVADLLTERPTPEPPDPQEIPPRAPDEPLRGLVGLKLPWTRKWIFQLFVKKRRRKMSTLIFEFFKDSLCKVLLFQRKFKFSPFPLL